MKTCSRCAMSKPLSEFNENARYAGGYSTWCKACHKEASRAHYKKNKAAVNARAAAWAEQNKQALREVQRAFNARNKERRLAQHKEWAKANRDKRNASSAMRKAVKLRATPLWANMQAIQAVYAEARRIQEQTGQEVHVDHIVPLQSALVCGLHCEANLRVICAKENAAKKNYWWPDMPGIEDAQRVQDLFAHEVRDAYEQTAQQADLLEGVK